MDRFKECGPSAIDVEIRSLSPDMGGSVEVMCHFLKFVKYVLNTKKNFELVNAYLGLFLKVSASMTHLCFILLLLATKMALPLHDVFFHVIHPYAT